MFFGMTPLRKLLMLKAVAGRKGPKDLFNGSDMTEDARVSAVGIGEEIQIVSSAASKVYKFACELKAGEQYNIQYTIESPIATTERQWCISDADSKMVWYENMAYPMQEGINETTLTAHDDGYLWMTMDKNASGIHIYKTENS